MDGGGGETYGCGGGRREGGWAWAAAAADSVFSRSSSSAREDDEEDLRWAALEKLPTYDRARTALLALPPDGELREVNVRRLAADEQRALLERVAGVADDHAGFLCMFKERLDRVGIKLPTIEVRYENLNVEAESYVGSRAEMLVTPGRALFMDEILTGLDSSTTFQIVNSIRQTVHILGGTTIIALLQPAPETYELFDEIIILSDGQVVYNGPRDHVLEFFQSIGFKCPERKGVADFLQEVTSRKDQKQYWTHGDSTYRYISAAEIAEAFQSFHVGQAVRTELVVPFGKGKSHPAALRTSKYGVSMKELLQANIDREILLMKRNSFLYIFQAIRTISGFSEPLGRLVLESRGFFPEAKWYWIGVGALLGYVILLNVLYTICLIFLTCTVDVNNDEATSNHMIGNSSSGIKGMVLPFVPLSITFEDIKYSIDMPEMIIEEVMELVELYPLKDALVGLPGVSGLSIEQRKRLTIAVELVANPSIIFLDEPTSGLDARAAAIVMRAIRNTVDTGRTVVCTIHQPSIDIFESFDERIPIWWRWYYWICPVAWTLNGLVTSQFGDVSDKFDDGERVSDFVKNYFGFHHELLWVPAMVVVSFAVLFAFLFGLSLRLFNFQKR
ncbi:hypothetical protein OsJ_28930 [Oryza sativa Japonica Group]|uniref:ABC transporter domain-containing protein n=1 Tax=Oryza sativa subsp. japonica TaxID=39947 RepID=B9G2Z8_ORYSJ|nr:hypothetical protein OsJ_28930 [Oryza sativa Japonica Group]